SSRNRLRIGPASHPAGPKGGRPSDKPTGSKSQQENHQPITESRDAHYRSSPFQPPQRRLHHAAGGHPHPPRQASDIRFHPRMEFRVSEARAQSLDPNARSRELGREAFT